MALELESKVENEDGEGITVEDLAGYLKVSTKTVRRDIDKGLYQKLKTRGPNNEVLLKPPPGYDPNVAAAAREAGEQVTFQTLVNVLGTMVNEGRRHNERLIDLLAGPQEKQNERQARREDMLFNRIEALQDKVIEQSAVVERLLSEEHQRILATIESEQRSKRLDQALEMAKDALPAVLDGLSLRNVNVRKLKAAETVLSAIPLEQIEIILSAKGDDAILPIEAQDAAAVLLAEMKKDAAAKAAQQVKPPTEGVADPSVGGAKTEG